jgi:hypothetical protein
MRQTHEGGARMREIIVPIGQPLPHGRGSDYDAPGSDQSRDREGAVASVRAKIGSRGGILLLFLACAPLFAAVTGTVTNQTTGKPQAGATVALYKLATATGLELIDQAKSDAQGNFTINQTPQGPHLIRTAFDGVTYNHMLPPGQPTTGIPIEVFNASTQPGAAKVAKHMILFEPSAGQVAVSETYLFKNEGKTAWNDPESGTLKFFLPSGAGKPTARATAPGGMPLGAPVNKTGKPDILAVDFAIKPGDTQIDVSYSMPSYRRS